MGGGAARAEYEVANEEEGSCLLGERRHLPLDPTTKKAGGGLRHLILSPLPWEDTWVSRLGF